MRYRLTQRMLGYQFQPPPASLLAGLSRWGKALTWVLHQHKATHLDDPRGVLLSFALLAGLLGQSLTLSMKLFILGLLEICPAALIWGCSHHLSGPHVLSVGLVMVYWALNLLGC